MERSEAVLDYELISKDGETAVYRYFVEGRRESEGTVTIVLQTSECKIEPPSSDAHFRYAHHLCSRLREFNQAGAFRESGTIMWH